MPRKSENEVSQIWRNMALVVEALAQTDRQPRVILLRGDPATIPPDEVNEAIRHVGGTTTGRVIIIFSREV